MSPELMVPLAILAGLLIASFCFSAAETAIFSLNPVQIHRIKAVHPSIADLIRQMLARPTQLLSTILTGNTLVNMASASVAYVAMERITPTYAEVISVVGMTLILLLFCEVTPKRLAMVYPERLAVIFVPVLVVLVKLLGPLRWFVEKAANLLCKDLHAPNRALTEDEILSVVEVGMEEGVLDEEEQMMVGGIINLEDLHASEVMTPRVDVAGIDLDDPPDTYLESARRLKFRYLPVFKGSLDHPVGFLDVPKFLLAESREISTAIMAPFFVPEAASLDVVLKTLQDEKRSIAYVSDEFGGTAGLITLDDIMDEIISGVPEEHERERLTIQRMDSTRWIVDGSTSLEDINDALEVQLEAEGADRIAGWIMEQSGRMLPVGETVEAQGIRATVHRTRRHRIVTVFIEKVGSPTAGTPESTAEETA